MSQATIITESFRNHPDRLKAAQDVQVRDAEPLIALEKHLKKLINFTNSTGGAVFLSVEDDVPLAFVPPFPLEVHFEAEQEDKLFHGEICVTREAVCAPILIGNVTVGYIGLPKSESLQILALMEVYSCLMAKELELANQTATLRYQNESISRKQKQLEQVIGFKNNILSLTTHDIRSPLSAVIGFMDMLEQGIRHQQPIDYKLDILKRMRFGLSNVADLVDQLNEIALLELERIELNTIKVDLNWLAQEVCDVMHGPALAKKHQLVFKRAHIPLYVEVDIPKAKRVLFNLINNAIKYTSNGGIIEVSLSQEKRMAHVSVRDNGIGIPKEKQEAIFEPFHKINQYGTNGESATGLGLFTSSYFIQLFKGSISVESEPKIGSTFTVHLPLQSIEF
ncbi:HAMP domain-containing histidine kinase [bacterium]|nr:MAG: HAMP domain-containing histidine kinase [bacterium]